jgi:hypothetical protein
MAKADKKEPDEIDVDPVRELEDEDQEPEDIDDYLDWEVSADVDADEKSTNIGLESSGKGLVAAIIAGFLGLAAFVVFSTVIIAAIAAVALVLTGIGNAIASRIHQNPSDDEPSGAA